MIEPQKNAEKENQNSFCVLCEFLRPFFGFVPLLVILLFLGALFWAKGQNPFSRVWFTLKIPNHGSIKCVAVMPKPMRQYPMVVFAHGSGGSLMNDGNDLRQVWEEFYPRIRHESSPEDAARIVVRHLRERVTIADLPNPSRDVPTIWLRQITDQTGFEIIYVAALRSVGVPARLNSQQQAEFWDGTQWRTAPAPSVVTW